MTEQRQIEDEYLRSLGGESGGTAAAFDMASGGASENPQPLLLRMEEYYKSESYSFLQLVMGIIAISLPMTLVLLDRLIFGNSPRSSISAYYWSTPGGVFVGALCAIAVFLLAYDYRPRPGYKADKRLSNIAAVAMTGVALFPTAPDEDQISTTAIFVSRIHIACAVVVFACLAIFSLVHFTKTSHEDNRTDGSLATRFLRNFKRSWQPAPPFPESLPDDGLRDPLRPLKRRIHQACGWTIVACIFACAALAQSDASILVPESLAVMAFGCSWLVKSEWVPLLRSPRARRLREIIGPKQEYAFRALHR